jgi:hypothetical protein
MRPYVISEAHPDYKRPWVFQDFGVVEEEEMQTYFLDKICNFILERVDIDSLEYHSDVVNFFDTYFCEHYMGNFPWEAMVFIDGEWESMTPSNKQIWKHIQHIKSQEKEEEKEEDEDTEDETEYGEETEYESEEEEKIKTEKLKKE